MRSILAVSISHQASPTFRLFVTLIYLLFLRLNLLKCLPAGFPSHQVRMLGFPTLLDPRPTQKPNPNLMARLQTVRRPHDLCLFDRREAPMGKVT
ncbi:hypothetical protein OUZ56_029533 [Daphnia magna]|uniref:Secreted protein n=1 Tax=Daphnia magna TaxID=35525 RepID=A0ABR0B752_9CRUS|nr:hypothetical protein OUZ56_029533 [Daphnia magna]